VKWIQLVISLLSAIAAGLSACVAFELSELAKSERDASRKVIAHQLLSQFREEIANYPRGLLCARLVTNLPDESAIQFYEYKAFSIECENDVCTYAKQCLDRDISKSELVLNQPDVFLVRDQVFGTLASFAAIANARHDNVGDETVLFEGLRTF